MSEEKEPVFCIDCEHCIVPDSPKGSYACKLKYDQDLITGEKTYDSCIHLRYHTDSCGSKGKLFEPKSNLTNKEQ